MLLIYVGIGGFIGAILRHQSTLWINGLFAGNFPWGTVTVNIIGSFFLGLAAAVFQTGIVSPGMRLFLTSGLLGAFTTFSTFSLESLVLLQNGHAGKALLNIFISVGIGLLMAYAGYSAGRAIG